MKIYLLLGFVALLMGGFIIKREVFPGIKKTYKIETSDIARFWEAYDGLNRARTAADSAGFIQHLYLDRMSDYGKKYIEARKYTAIEYIKTIRKYPKYFIGLRKKTAQLLTHKADIDSAFSKLSAVIPDFNYPDVCFAIGCFRGGGTKTKDKQALLIGCEIALADSTMDLSEFKGSLYTMFSHADGNLPP